MKYLHELIILIIVFWLTIVNLGCDSGGSSSSSDSVKSISTDSVNNERLITDFTGPNSVTIAGTWTNETFMSTGDVTVDVSFDTNTKKITIIYDIDGNVYGGADPGAETFTIDMAEFITNGTANLTATSTTYGDISATLTFYTDNSGEFTGTAENEPSGNVTNQKFEGCFEIANGVVTFYVDSATFDYFGQPVTCTNYVTSTIN